MLATRVLAFALLILVFATFASGDTQDPELKQCKHQCRVQQGFGEEEKKECTKMCDWYHKDKERRESEKGEGSQQGEGSSERFPGEQGQEEEQGQGQEGENPYVFQEHHFTTRFQNQHGRFRVLPRFTHRLLWGIKNFRFAILEAEPRTFIIPGHWDSDNICFVIQGEGSFSLLREDSKRESFNIREGDVISIPSGFTVYLTNRHNSQKLIVAKLLRPVSNSGELVALFSAGAGPWSYYHGFSPDVLQAALNTREDALRATIYGSGQLSSGPILEASEEQIQALSQHGEGGIWPFGGGRKGAVNIFEEEPSQSNEYGRLHEVDANKLREPQDVNVAFSFVNITPGGMLGPLYNSKTTLVSFVLEGKGDWEMSCPHLSSQHQGSQQEQEQWGGESTGTQHYVRVSSSLRRGAVFIVPPGHPYVLVASNNQNLQVVSFKINDIGNKRFQLAGKRAIIKLLERAAKELTFDNVPARIVDKVFGNQDEEFFFKGPVRGQQEEGGRADG